MKVNKILSMVLDYYKTNVLRDDFAIAIKKWFLDEGDSTFRLQYPLVSDSVVFDVGGYKGDWSDKIVKRYEPYIYIFEPVPIYFREIEERFSSNVKVNVYNFGLSDKDCCETMSINEDGSSVFQHADSIIPAQFRDISSFIDNNDIKKIDLIKINIEGGEYSLLQRMIEKNILRICDNIQVQFHNIFPDAANIRRDIRNVLKETHFPTYDYTFVWENWEIKK